MAGLEPPVKLTSKRRQSPATQKIRELGSSRPPHPNMSVSSYKVILPGDQLSTSRGVPVILQPPPQQSLRHAISPAARPTVFVPGPQQTRSKGQPQSYFCSPQTSRLCARIVLSDGFAIPADYPIVRQTNSFSHFSSDPTLNIGCGPGIVITGSGQDGAVGATKTTTADTRKNVEGKEVGTRADAPIASVAAMATTADSRTKRPQTTAAYATRPWRLAWSA